MSFFVIFSLRIKKDLFWSGKKVPGSKGGQPLIFCSLKVSSGRVRAHLYRMRQLNPENSKKYFVSLASEEKKFIK